MIDQTSKQLAVVTLSDDPAFTDEIAAVRALTPVGDVILDFTAVTYVTSANLSTLLMLRQYLNGNERRLRLCSISPRVWPLFTVTGLNQVFEVVESVELAKAALQ